jgi:hypothetical protein
MDPNSEIKLKEKKHFYETFTKKYDMYFERYKSSKNKLLSAILYSRNIFCQNDLFVVITHFNKYIELIKSNENAFNLLISLIFNYIAIDIIYSLPHLLNRPNKNSGCSVHILFGESIAQLVAFCLVTESSNILNQILKENNNVLNKINMNVSEKDEFILNSNEIDINKELIKKDYKVKFTSISNKYKEYFEIIFNN